MLGGAHGKVLHVDLTTGLTEIEEPGNELFRLLVGGRALIAYFLLRDLPPKTDPLSPHNILIFAPGILQGTSLPGSGRHAVGAKSPLTGAIGSSEVGGWWGDEFKRSGYDAVIFQGRSEKPVYVFIENENVSIHPAGHLWGLPTADVQSMIRQELGDEKVRVAQIGVAGENLVRYSAVIHDVNRAAGRNGMGAVMGSKNLKAVTVRGTRKVPVADRKRMMQTSKWLADNYKVKSAWAASGRGTQDSLMKWGYMGGLPTRHYSQPVFEEREMLSGERNYAMFLKERDTCQSCPIYCKQVFQNETEEASKQLHPVYGGPEYEAMAALGSNCGMTDNLPVLKANELCNLYGLDTISTGMSISFVMDCFQRGILTGADTGGIEFRWGDGDVLLQAVKMIAHREGFGNVMAEGVARMARKFGPAAEPLNLTVKGQELAMHEPRLKHVLGLGYAIAPMGADHMANVHDTDYIAEGDSLKRVNSVLEKPVGPLSNKVINEEKMLIFYTELNWRHFFDSAVICHFYPYDYRHLAEAISGVTGVEYSMQDVLAVGERAQTLSRLFNIREGFTKEDDQLPKRVRKAFTEGPLAGSEITDETFAWARQRYYELMGWDAETGVPLPESIARLQLDRLLKFNSIS